MMTPATLAPPLQTTASEFSANTARCPDCLVPLVKADEHEARCAAGHVFRRVGLSLIPRDDRMATG